MGAVLKTLIDVAEADAILAEALPVFPAEEAPLAEAAGRVLREDVRAERDQPPFHRVTMDGIAFSSEAWRGGRREFRVEGLQAAGDPQRRLESPEGCIEVMTGAVLPEGCDCVVRIEDVDLQDGTARLTADGPIKPMQNVHRQGTDHEAGTLVLEAGRRLNGPSIGLAASCGRASLRVGRPPVIGIATTGDELVDPGEPLLPHQIRRSNPYALAAALQRRGFPHPQLRHIMDDEKRLEEVLGELLGACGVLILTGGVSMGRFDYVPSVLQALGVMPLFHKVRQRPGKPLLFGLGPSGQAVFALPGNPVSALVCLYRYVMPSLERALGLRARPQPLAALAEPVEFAPDLAYFLPVRVRFDDGGRLVASPRPANTSGDVAALADSDGFVELERTRNHFPAGHVAALYRWDD